MSNADAIESNLRSILTPELHYAIPLLTQVLDEISKGGANIDDAKAKFSTDPELLDVLRALNGQKVATEHAIISFGMNSQTGDIQIRDVAGRDINQATLNIGTQQIFIIYKEQLQDGMDSISLNVSSDSSVTNFPRTDPNRLKTLKKMRAIWIEGFLDQISSSGIQIALELTENPDDVALPQTTMYQEMRRTSKRLPSGVNILNVFDKSNGELLLLGAAGSGKTTLLLNLSRELIVRAERDASHPIPIILNLSSWSDKRIPIRDWLVREMHFQYLIPERVSTKWLEENNILLLLDGLDEVNPVLREDCVNQLNILWAECEIISGVVCCRLGEYRSLSCKLRLSNAVIIEPLSTEVLRNYFKDTDILSIQRLSPFSALTTSIDLELISTPLALQIWLIANEIDAEEGMFVGSPSEMRQKAFDTYIRGMFRRRHKALEYSSEATLTWLVRLAQEMRSRNRSTFFIEELQFDWLPSSRQKKYISAAIYLQHFTVVLIFGVLFSWVIGLLAGGISLLFFRPKVKIDLSETISFSWGKLMSILRKYTVFFLTPGVLILLTLGAFTNTSFQLILSIIIGVGFLISWGVTLLATHFCWIARRTVDAEISISRSFKKVLINAIIGTATVLLYTITSSLLVFGLILVLSGTFRTNSLPSQTIPAPVIIGTEEPTSEQSSDDARNTSSTALCAAFPCNGLLGTDGSIDFVSVLLLIFRILLYQIVLFGLWVTISLPPLVFIIGGLRSFALHYFLRIGLTLENTAPLNYRKFLNYCVSRVFLYQTGSGYTFFHYSFMEYLAALSDNDISRLSSDSEFDV